MAKHSYQVKLIRSAPVRLSPHPASPSPEKWEEWACSRRRPIAVDLFSGGGGLSLGLEQAGYCVALAVDHDAWAIETHRHNIEGNALESDLGDPERLSDLISMLRRIPIDLIAAGPPCQPFSRAGRSKIRSLVQQGIREQNDDRAQLWKSFIEIVKKTKPTAALMENVPDMALGDDLSTVREITAELQSAGYDVYTRLLEAWYRELVAKAIIFRATERIVSRQPWYQGGYRANIVAYAIAKLAYDVADMKHSVDFEAIWKRQSPGAAIEDALAYVSREVHEVLVNPPEGISNVTEWAKKQACWERVRRLPTRWASAFVNELISEEERKSERLAGRRDQKLLNGIEAQTAVVQAGPAFWKVALAWGRSRRLLTTREMSVIGVATRLPTRIPSEAQSKVAMKALAKLEVEGFQERPHN